MIFFSLNFKGMWRKSLSQYVVQKYNSILQPSLNCEELDAKLGLELRWTMSQDDIILQLVSNTGNDRYLALGIRDPTESKGIAGKKGFGYFQLIFGMFLAHFWPILAHVWPHSGGLVRREYAKNCDSALHSPPILPKHPLDTREHQRSPKSAQ